MTKIFFSLIFLPIIGGVVYLHEEIGGILAALIGAILLIAYFFITGNLPGHIETTEKGGDPRGKELAKSVMKIHAFLRLLPIFLLVFFGLIAYTVVLFN